jgi:ABC-2 type transport system permease protein
MLSAIRELVAYRFLLATLIGRDLKVRYRRSVLGVLWTMVNPLLMMIVLTIVFSNIFRFTAEHFTIYFLSAFVLWTFFAQTTTWATACLLGYAPLIRKIYVPKEVFILATVLSGLVNLLISLLPLAAIMLVVRHPFTVTLAFLPVAILLALAFSLGVSMLLAGVCIEFNDVVQIYQAALLAWMYLTPVVYPLTAVPEKFRWLILVNPMTHLVEVFRSPIYYGVLPGGRSFAYAAVWSISSLVVGWVFFRRHADRIAYLV